MSKGTIKQVMARIELAQPNSPIAVFRCLNQGQLEAFFASTMQTQKLILEKDPDYLGTFHKEMDLRAVKGLLERNVRGPCELGRP